MNLNATHPQWLSCIYQLYFMDYNLKTFFQFTVDASADSEECHGSAYALNGTTSVPNTTNRRV